MFHDPTLTDFVRDRSPGAEKTWSAWDDEHEEVETVTLQYVDRLRCQVRNVSEQVLLFDVYRARVSSNDYGTYAFEVVWDIALLTRTSESTSDPCCGYIATCLPNRVDPENGVVRVYATDTISDRYGCADKISCSSLEPFLQALNCSTISRSAD